MSNDSPSVVEHPRLRMVDAQSIPYEGEKYLYLRDPFALSDKTIIIPQPLIPLLALCDGTRSPSGLRGALALRYGLALTPAQIDDFLQALDDALLLENAHSRAARRQAEQAYRLADQRDPASAGHAYPADPANLSALLHGYLDAQADRTQPMPLPIRGVVSPHIDYERGGAVYAQVWGAATQAARDAQRAIIFGTDHFSEGFEWSLTRQNYATPLGVLPTDRDIVDALVEVIGEEAAFAGELHHRQEHSIELAAVWLHHVRGGKPIRLVPVLTGSLQPGATLEAVLDVLRQAAQSQPTLIIAAADLAHIGPAFDTPPVDSARRENLRQADAELIEAICQGSAETFLQAIQRENDPNNVCGEWPIYVTLRLLDAINAEQGSKTTGTLHGYAVCPADEQNTSVVTVCGVTLS